MWRLMAVVAALLLPACEVANTSVNSTELDSMNQASSRLLLISIDGYRYDYTDLHQPPFLTEFRANGATLASLRPAYPSKTFPNHLTLVTGMRPARHGIVFNSFYAPELDARYSLKDRAAIQNPDFYLAEPLWVLMERAGYKTATYFWPGSEAPINGITPTQFEVYKHSTPPAERVDKVLHWIAQKGPDAPRFMSLYFSQIDDAGHDFGPTAPETKQAVLELDHTLAQLWHRAQQLDPELNVVIVSDHGMQARVEHQQVALFSEQDQHIAANYQVVGHGPSVQLYKRASGQADPEQDAAQLNRKAEHFTCYTGATAPSQWAMAETQRMGDILCAADNYWNITANAEERFSAGNHGWSTDETLEPGAKDLHAIFYARGPAFKAGALLPTRDNIHVMPLLAHILGIDLPAPVDGNLTEMQDLLRTP